MKRQIQTNMITIPSKLVYEILSATKQKRAGDFIKESILRWYTEQDFREKVEQCIKSTPFTDYDSKDLSAVRIGSYFRKYLHEIAGISHCTIPTLIQCFLRVRSHESEED